MSTEKWSLTKIANFMAYVAVMFIAVALALGKWIPSLAVLKMVAEVIAVVITAIAAFFYARSKHSIWFMIFYIIGVVLIAATYIF